MNNNKNNNNTPGLGKFIETTLREVCEQRELIDFLDEWTYKKEMRTGMMPYTQFSQLNK